VYKEDNSAFIESLKRDRLSLLSSIQKPPPAYLGNRFLVQPFTYVRGLSSSIFTRNVSGLTDPFVDTPDEESLIDSTTTYQSLRPSIDRPRRYRLPNNYEPSDLGRTLAAPSDNGFYWQSSNFYNRHRSPPLLDFQRRDVDQGSYAYGQGDRAGYR